LARDQAYVIDLCDDVLGRTAQREHRFDFLRGDPNARGLCVRLPVDAYYAHIRLVIEYWERQHTESVAHFDRRQTISGMTRAAQRRRYDERRRTILPANGIRLIILSFDLFPHDRQKRLVRDENDYAIVRDALADYL